MTKPQEKRRTERKQPAVRVLVFDVITGDEMGQLGNITPDGLMLITDQPVMDGSIFQLNFALSDPADQTTFDFSVGATSLWGMEAASGNYWSGFQIIDISDDQQESLNRLYSLM